MDLREVKMDKLICPVCGGETETFLRMIPFALTLEITRCTNKACIMPAVNTDVFAQLAAQRAELAQLRPLREGYTLAERRPSVGQTVRAEYRHFGTGIVQFGFFEVCENNHWLIINTQYGAFAGEIIRWWPLEVETPENQSPALNSKAE
jgi:hypothetical protein